MKPLSELRTKSVPTPTRQPKDGEDCCVACNRALAFAPGDTMLMIRIEQDGAFALHREDFGAYPLSNSRFEFIGPECARKFGPEFLFTESEGMYYCDASFHRPFTLGPATDAEVALHKLSEDEIIEIERSVMLEQDLPEHWRRDLISAPHMAR